MATTRPLRPIGEEKLGNLQAWFPRDRAVSDPPQDDTFEIGLTFAGGQSAGCYLAGVLDFLFEALDAWEQARKADPARTPNHKVRIKIVTGASAGGLNTALAAIAGRYRFEPARHAKFEDGDKNLGSPFYRAWVRDVDLKHLLTTEDLTGNSGSFSVLNTQYLDAKVASYLDFKGDGLAERDWLDDPLPIAVMISNVDGVPYRIKFRTEDENDASANAYWMTLHGDRLAFLRPMAAGAPQPTRPDSDALSLDNSAAADDWKRLGQAVLATIAFPLALRERIVGRPSTDYDYRFAYPFDPGGLVYAPPFPGDAEQQRSFVTIDGGVTDNEPFELAHTALAGTDGRNVREGEKAKRAVILTAPFVSPKPVQYGVPDTPLPRLLGNIFNALIGQSRFKLMDVSLAANADIYSRFMIAPVRVQASGSKVRGDAALASHPLTSFFGYFSEPYRHHDFMLGRLNCYLFLRDWFVLPSTHAPGDSGPKPGLGNSLFANWPDAALADPAYKSQSPHVKDHRQIIPLIGTAAQQPQSYPWPTGQFAGYSAVRRGIEQRLDALYPLIRDRLLGAAVENGFFRGIVRLVVGGYWWLSGRGAVLGALRQMIDKAREQIDDDR
ncbi:MAG: patatin-like phospholipase family protein [Reyranella sp.]|uniref:patatin-like phospholipase family protein n=1 Tax=Reyranella sp. TaxID=1929291 RepID=UPI001AD13949|nr:patatin-like phospholipase family protein [Reyranella sp.]MBN9085357.1 patatin-like phospholipase family protein [Reyranella sp.]